MQSKASARGRGDVLFAMRHCVMAPKGVDMTAPELEETTDPILQKAINRQHSASSSLSPAGVWGEPEPATSALFRCAPSWRRRDWRRRVRRRSAALCSGELVGTFAGNAMDSRPPAHTKKHWLRGLAQSWKALPRAWVVGLLVFAAFMLANGVTYATLSERVYPGVRIGQENLGGMPLSEVHERIVGLANPVELSVVASGVSYRANTSAASADEVLRIEDQVRRMGHDTPMPLAGLVETMLSRPLALHVQISDELAKTRPPRPWLPQWTQP